MVFEPKQSTECDAVIGRRLRERRASLGLRQEDLARSLGVTQRQIQKYEVGVNRISACRLAECARLLQVPIGYFLPESAAIAAAAALTDAERSLLETYRRLGQHEQLRLSRIIEAFTEGAT